MNISSQSKAEKLIASSAGFQFAKQIARFCAKVPWRQFILRRISYGSAAQKALYSLRVLIIEGSILADILASIVSGVFRCYYLCQLSVWNLCADISNFIVNAFNCQEVLL